MDFVFTFVILTCCLHMASAQSYADSFGTVRGLVLNAVTNRPVSRAEVILNQERAVLTDESGQFEFDHVLLRENLIIVRKPGFLDPALNGAGESTANTVDPSNISANAQHRIRLDGTNTAITLKLVPTASISGHVTLSLSDPRDGIRVVVYKKQAQNGRSHWVLAGTATTKSDGVFRVGNLPPGNYILYTQPFFGVSNSRVERGAKWGYPSVYYPGVSDPSLTSILNLLAGQTENIELILTRERFYPITATVKVLPAEDKASFQILDRSERPTSLPARYDKQQQVLRAEVPSGSWILEGHSFGGKATYGRTEFRVAQSPVSLELNILPLTSLPIIVRREQATLETQTGAEVFLNLSSSHEFGGWGALRRQLHSESDQADHDWVGTIDAPPGQYWVDTASWAGYVASITSGGVDLNISPINVSSEGSVPPIEIDIRRDAAKITGRIGGQISSTDIRHLTSGEELGTYVYAIPLSLTSSQVATGSMEPDGQFTVSNLAPGSYRVVACDSPQNIDFHSAEGLAEWQGKGQIVSVDPGGTTRVQIEVIHSGLTQ